MSQFNIDRTLSVYDLTKRNREDIELHNHRQTMSTISYEIENASIVDDATTTVFACFQFMSRFLPQVARYRQLAMKSQHVYIFGIVDCDLPEIDNLTYVPIDRQHQLSKEWFVISYGPHYASALATQELSDTHAPDAVRTFKGIWSFDEFFVGVLYEWLSGLVNLQIDPDIHKQYDYHAQRQYVDNIITRLNRQLQDKSQAIHSTDEELKHAMQVSLYPAYERLQEKTRKQTM